MGIQVQPCCCGGHVLATWYTVGAAATWNSWLYTIGLPSGVVSRERQCSSPRGPQGIYGLRRRPTDGLVYTLTAKDFNNERSELHRVNIDSGALDFVGQVFSGTGIFDDAIVDGDLAIDAAGTLIGASDDVLIENLNPTYYSYLCGIDAVTGAGTRHPIQFDTRVGAEFADGVTAMDYDSDGLLWAIVIERDAGGTFADATWWLMDPVNGTGTPVAAIGQKIGGCGLAWDAAAGKFWIVTAAVGATPPRVYSSPNPPTGPLTLENPITQLPANRRISALMLDP